ncbi:adenylate kinase family protein [Nitrososphaera viennensis]|uniref:AAA family ATPase n=2 Tax=Nitrososphaera viennensis TaxID=1034015 RepID=A0A977ICT3_9ARCH|nr:AAA family ATPase [Nitrososphaera viennensis]AIC16519.1 putative adenylate kinase [Nitrososphaera viennensis EN76]UVS68452.1 AAA family ATPase [Nitrososphaera viennensis]
MKTVRLVITGNPGVGKHTSAQLVARELKAEIIDINKVALDNGAVLEKTGKGIEVDTKKASKLVANILNKKKKGSFVIVGHLAPYVMKKSAGIDMAAVLRRSPRKLEETLLERKYIREKVNENVSAEILGISLYDSIKAFGKRKVAEFDTTGKTPEQTAEEIIATVQKERPRRSGSVDWLAVISEEEVQRYFSY